MMQLYGNLNDDRKSEAYNDPSIMDRRRRDLNSPTFSRGTTLNETMLLVIHDPEMMQVNPIAEKNQKLMRHADDDGDVRPTIDDKNRLMKIIASPSRELSEQDKRMLWKFRNSLVDLPKALTKFLRSVKQDDEDSVVKAVDLMKKWADIQVADALELLSVHFVDSRIREFAIEVLQRANYEDLELYLMQLVQALRFETQQEKSALAKFLLDKALKCDQFRLLNFLYWSVYVLKLEEQEDTTGDNNNNNGNNNGNNSNNPNSYSPNGHYSNVANEYSESRYTNYLQMIIDECKEERPDYYEEIQRQIWLVDKLLVLSEDVGKHRGRAEDKKKYLRQIIATGKYKDLQNFAKPVLIPVRPTLRVYGLVGDQCSVFKSAMCPLLLAFKVAKHAKEENGNYYDKKSKKSTFDDYIDDTSEDTGLSNRVSRVSQTVPRSKPPGLKDSGSNGSNSSNSHSHSNKLDKGAFSTRKRSSGILRGSLTGDALALQNSVDDGSIKLPLTEWDIYRIIWKNGDDLRQDQLIIQMINLMDILLKRVNLDLCLTPYPVLATGLESGMMEFVEDSSTIARVLKSYNDDIKQFLNENSAKRKNMQQVVDTFVRSCAGYCVITFLLGVGDRHLDNILITKHGHLFHIDFGFIYGDDPKPWPPPMKICKQMIDAMGGYNSNLYKQFQEHMVSCYKQLRKSANLLLNLLSLMGGKETVSNRHANNLSKQEMNMVQTIEDNVTFVHNKFRLDLNEGEAAIYLQNIAEQSVNALFTKIVDKVHDWATYWR